MSKLEAHINRLFRDIPDSKRKTEIMQEIMQDVNDKVADIVLQGQDEGEAIQNTIENFGEIDDIREELVGSERLMENRNIGLPFAFSAWGSALISALCIFINLYYAPEHIWLVYPVFAVIWWPIMMWFKSLRKKYKGDGFFE